MNRTLLISDTHLGSDISKVKYLIPILQEKLENNLIDRIILLGDIFQDINFKRLKKHHWNFLSLLRKYSDAVEIIWVVGNHDIQISDVMSHLVGIPTYEKYVWAENDKKYCAIHGHQFDKTINRFVYIKTAVIELYLKIQKIKYINKLLSNIVNYSESKISKLQLDVRVGAINFAKHHDYDYIFCGHTHISEHHIANNINYYNTGCWVNEKGTFILIENNDINLYNFDTNA